MIRNPLLRTGVRGTVLGGVAVACLGAFLLDSSPALGADSAPGRSDYQLSAEAQGLQITVIDPGAPLIQRYDAAPYGASATLTSLGTSAADAGAPYSPGISALPGTISGLGGATGLFPPVPSLPGYVYSSYPVRETDEQRQGPYTINATSSENSSQGFVSMGSSAPGDDSTLFSVARVAMNPDGVAEVSGRSGIDRISIAGVLDIANVSSLASITKAAGKPSAYATTTNLGAVTLSGTTLDLAGQAKQQDLTPAAIAGLNTALAPAGVTLTYLPARYVFADGSTGSAPEGKKVIQSVDSAALQVDVTQNVPGQGDVVTRYVLGRVFVGATNDPTGVLAPISTTPAIAPASGLPAVGGADLGTLPGVLPGTVPADQSVLTAAPGTALTYSGQLPLGPSGRTLYLALALAAVVTLAGTQVMSRFGVRLAVLRRKS
jgi:hypothetical protein